MFDFELDDGTDLEFGTPEWDTYVTESLQSGIDALDRHRAPASPCSRCRACGLRTSRAAACRRCPSAATTTASPTSTTCGASVAEANPDTVTFVSGPTEWCDDEDVSSDVGYRWDGVHVYTPGANLIYTTIAPALLTL